MTNKSKTHTRTPYTPKMILMIVGALLAFGWPIIIARSSTHLFYCSFASAKPCVDQGNLSDILVLGPTVIGGFLLSLRYAYSKKLDRSAKILIIFAATAVFSFLAYWYILAWFWLEIYLLGS